VRIPLGREAGRRCHPARVDPIHLLRGQGLLAVGEADVPVAAGRPVAFPFGIVHTRRNTGSEPLERLAFFTPPPS